MTATRFCTECGSALQPRAGFCVHCGVALPHTSGSPPAAPVTPPYTTPTIALSILRIVALTYGTTWLIAVVVAALLLVGEAFIGGVMRARALLGGFEGTMSAILGAAPQMVSAAFGSPVELTLGQQSVAVVTAEQ